MRKYFIVFCIIAAFGFFYFYNPFKEKIPLTRDASQYVALNGKQFVKDGKSFYPVCMNYIVAVQTDRKDLFVAERPAMQIRLQQWRKNRLGGCREKLVEIVSRRKILGVDQLS